MNDHIALFEVIGPNANAVNSAVTKFLDIQDIGESAPGRVAVFNPQGSDASPSDSWQNGKADICRCFQWSIPEKRCVRKTFRTHKRPVGELAEESGSRTHQEPAGGPFADLKSGRPTGDASPPLRVKLICQTRWAENNKRGRLLASTMQW